MRRTKTALLKSALALLCCCAMLIGSTFAWFTDSVTSGRNIIATGTLDVELYHSNGAVTNEKVTENTKLFLDLKGNPILWEPGVVSYENLRITNEGDLALVYQLAINATNENYIVDGSNQYGLSQVLKVAVVKGGITATDRESVIGSIAASEWKNLASFQREGALVPDGEETWGVAIYWQPTASDNLWNANNGKTLSSGDALSIDLGIHLTATQMMYENDSFGNDYDVNAKDDIFPSFGGGTSSAEVSVDANGLTAADVTIAIGDISAIVPAGVKVQDGVTALTLSIKEMESSRANIVLGENEALRSLDVHIEGVAADNITPITVVLPEAAPVGLNLGNYKLYHVEGGATNEMTLVASAGDFSAHNQFVYDPATGDMVLYMASFSEVAMVADTENAWEGKFDYTWYDADAKNLTIANADQLAAFGAIVGGMAEGIEQDSFKDKTVKLIADINLGDDEDHNNPDLIFYPIGYYYNGDSSAPYSTVYSFEGTFDGNGHIIGNFYQNTWEIKGDYDGNYYKDAMGLFGYVVNGTIKNLTVDHFSSDGEFTPTGVIAAYASNSTFENIAITNCNPRVYNTGNGGIVGIGGNSDDPDTYQLTFTNITIDNTNKISALWGSWDVACGGLVGMFRGAGHVDMTNCHVAAQIDVYNDVCGNYQYYWYRYSGMMIGTNKNMITDEDGYTVPETSKFDAKGCTVHFGDWNDYYYCELVANTLASYTHDHQFSRLEQISSLDEIKSGDTWTKTGNFLLISGDTKTCYHIVNKDGVLTQHNHEDAGTETVNGEIVLKENNQIVYLPFNQLFTGYGWGVKHIPVYNGEDYAFEGITILDREVANSVEKFEGKVESLTDNREYTLGEIFSIKDSSVAVYSKALIVSITNLDEKGNVIATIDYDRDNWANSTIKFENHGNITITIQDYYFCTPTTITVNVTGRQSEEKFDVVMNNGDFLHRVGNSGTVALDKLFKAKAGAGTPSVTIEAVNGTSASGTYSNNAIQFSGTGVVKVTITDNNYCIPTELYLEVVDATNATSATDAKDKDVVLLNNIGSSFTIDNGHTVYGNGFTLTYTGDGRYLNNGLKQGVVMVQNGGTLDNLRIKASIYPTAFMYYGTTVLGDYVQQSTNPREVDGTKTRYYYQLSAVATYGNATISNCYIYGGRTNVYVNTGNVTIKDSVLECGVVANVQIQSTSEYTVTLDNVTTIQYQNKATIGDTSKVMLGVGVLVGPETTSNPTIVLEGDFKQYNWVNADDQDAVSSQTAKMIVGGALDATAFNHTVNNKTASNLGIIYMNEATVTHRNNTVLPYELADVTMKYESAEVKGQVYSLQNATAAQIYSDYVNADRSTVNGDYIPTFDFDLGTQEISYDGSEDTRYLYGDKNGVIALYQDGDAALTLDLSKLATIYKYTGLNYTVTAICKNASGNALTATNNVVTLDAQGEYTLEFTVNDNIFYDKNGNAVTKSVERTFSVPLTLTVKEANVKNADVSIKKTALDGVYTTVNLTDYKLRINFLDAISVTDYDNKGNGTTVSLSSNIASVSLTPASVNVFTTASTITVTYTDGRVLTVNLSNISGSSPGTKTATVNTSGGLYFITEGALDNKPTESKNQNKCTITSVSFKGNSGSTVTNDTDVTVTWALGSSGGGGCVTPDTLITLADGSQKPINQVTYADQILVWDFVTGKYVAKSSSIVMNHGYDLYDIVTLNFADGTTVNTINGHGFFDVQENKFVILNKGNVEQYIGHSFVKDADKMTTAKLVSYSIKTEYTESWSVLTSEQYNCILEGMLTITPAEVEGSTEFLMPYEIGADMKYDEAKMQADIELYGLYTYADFAEYCTYEQFVALGLENFKVSVAKGYITWDEIIFLLNLHMN